MRDIAQAIFLYNLALQMAYLASLHVAPILAGYGIHRFINDLLKTGNFRELVEST